MNKTITVVMVSVILASGCGVIETQQRAELKAQRDIEMAQVNETCKKLEDAPSTVPLRGKIQFQGDPDPSLAQMNDPSRATAADKPAIEVFEAARRQCAALNDQATAAYYPQVIVHALIAAQNRSGELTNQLYTGSITYGQYNSGRYENNENFKAELASIRARISTDRAANQMAEDERKRAVALTFLGSMQRPVVVAPAQPHIMPVPHQTTTNCQRFGNMVNCTSD